MVQKISNRQLALLFFTLIISTADIFLPSAVAKSAGPDAWFSVILATAVGLFLAYISVTICIDHKNKSLVKVMENTMGKYLGKFISIFFALYIIFQILPHVTRELVEIIRTIFLPGIPTWVIVILTLSLSTFSVYKGIEVIARCNEALVPLGIFILLFVILFGFRYVELDRFLPMFEKGILPSVRATIPLVGWLSQVMFISFVFPYINKPSKTLRFSLMAIAGLSLAFIGGTFTILIFGAEPTSKFIFSPYQVIESINIERVIHFDVFIMAVWIGGIFIKIFFYHFAAVESLKHTFALKDYKYLIIPIGIITAVFSLSEFRSIVELSSFLAGEVHVLGFSLFVILPTVLFLITKIKKTRSKP